MPKITVFGRSFIGFYRMWYAIRVTYGRELKFEKMLQEAGFETFVAMCRKKVVRGGHQVTVTAPAVSNLCFVNTEKADLDAFMKPMGEACPARYIWDKATGRPVVVPQKAMEDFITVSRIMADDVLYLKDITAKLREGQKVRITDGPFKGVEGTVLRIKRERRVVVELPGMLAVATTFIHPRNLEMI